MADAPVIAIDGPSGSGKGTAAHLLARKLGFHYLDSGALYRLVALVAERAGIALDDEPGLARLAQALPARFETAAIYLDGDEVTDAIRTEPQRRRGMRAGLEGVAQQEVTRCR